LAPRLVGGRFGVVELWFQDWVLTAVWLHGWWAGGAVWSNFGSRVGC
jgi:hypothetical protein